MKIPVLIALCGSLAMCQTQVDYPTQIKNKPIIYGSSLPLSCSIPGNQFFLTTTSALYVCDGANYSLVTANGAASGGVNVKTFGCIGDGTHNDQPCFVAAFASGKDLYVPAGNYLMDLSSLSPISPFTPYWGVGGYHGTITFSAQAKWVVIPPFPHIVDSMIIFDNWAGAVVNNLHITLQTPNTTPCIDAPGPSYCSPTLLLKETGTTAAAGATFNNLNIDDSLSIALIADGNFHTTFNNTNINQSAGAIFTGNEDMHINGFTCPGSWDDCLNVSTGGDSEAGQVGTFINGFYSVDSWSDGLRIQTPEVNLVNFTILGANAYGIDIDDQAVEVDPPARISISNGTIRTVSNTRGGSDGPACGVGIYTNVAGVNIGDVSIDNLHVINTDGAGICSGPISGTAGTLSVSNSHIDAAGQKNTLDGSCFNLSGFSAYLLTGNDCDVANGPGFKVDGLSVATVNITGGRIRDANTLQGSGDAILLHNVGVYDVGGVSIVDDKVTATSFKLAADGTVRPSLFHNINFYVQDVTHPPVLSAGSTKDNFSNLVPSITLANINGGASTPADGSSGYCSDCDTPASQGATCTAAGDHAGARFNINRGTIKCY